MKFKLPADKLMSACDACISEIMQHRQKAHKEFMDRAKAPTRFGPFRFKGMTNQQALKAAERARVGQEYGEQLAQVKVLRDFLQAFTDCSAIRTPSMILIEIEMDLFRLVHSFYPMKSDT